MFSRSTYENSPPGGVSVLEVLNDRARGELPGFVPLTRTELRGEVVGPLGDLRLVHTYRYTRQACDKSLEAVYRFPLPGDSAVTGVSVRFGDVEITTELKERESAEREYESAREEGQQAALLTRESPDVFSLLVTGLQPDQDVVVETRFVMRARTQGPGWNLRIPLTTAPRYARSDERGSRHARGQPLGLFRDPGHRFALDVRLEAADTTWSPTHQIAARADGDGQRLTLEDGEVFPDRDFVLCWRHGGKEDTGLEVLLHADPDHDYLYFMGLAAPPERRRREGVPRELVLLLDRSGSMAGAKWEAADWAVQNLLSGLSERDELAFGRFHSDVLWMSERPQSATPEVVEEARCFLEHKDSGGTELGVALEQALELRRCKAEVARHILVITDAQVTDVGRLLRLVAEESRRPDRRRISVLCIDAAPNSFLANQLAERGGGVAYFLTSNPEAEDISTALDELLADWAEPLYTGLHLEVSCPNAQPVSGRALDAPEGESAIDVGDLPAGRARWVIGRVPWEEGELRFSLRASGETLATRRVSVPSEGVSRPVLKSLFGAGRIAELEFLMSSFYEGEHLAEELTRLAYDSKEVLGEPDGRRPKVYAENITAEHRERLKALLVQESLAFGLASAETAFVAVRAEKGERVEGTVFVGNALPTGWSDEFTGSVSRHLAGAPKFYSAAPSRSRGAAPTLMSTGLASADVSTLLSGLVPRSVTQEREEVALFCGRPEFREGKATLFDSASDAQPTLPADLRFAGVRVEFPDGAPDPGDLDRELALLMFVGDLALPRAKARLADLVRHGGSRPLNVTRRAGEVIRIVLEDPNGTWATARPALAVFVRY